MRIAIAEKDQIGRCLLAPLLRMEGHDVLLFTDGCDAREFMRRQQPDVVLMNMCTTPETCQGDAENPTPDLTPCIRHQMMMSSIDACKKLSDYIKAGQCVAAEIFEQLPTRTITLAMEHVLHNCEVLSHKLRHTDRSEMKMPAMRSTYHERLDSYAR